MADAISADVTPTSTTPSAVAPSSRAAPRAWRAPIIARRPVLLFFAGERRGGGSGGGGMICGWVGPNDEGKKTTTATTHYKPRMRLRSGWHDFALRLLEFGISVERNEGRKKWENLTPIRCRGCVSSSFSSSSRRSPPWRRRRRRRRGTPPRRRGAYRPRSGTPPSRRRRTCDCDARR